MMRSRNEVDFLRLLKQSQKIADQRSWRLERYVDTLSEYLDKLRNQNVNQLSRDALEEYGRKIQFLRGIIETEKLPSAEKRLLAAELLAPDRETKATHLITRNKYHEQMRQELLLSNCYRTGSSNGSGGGAKGGGLGGGGGGGGGRGGVGGGNVSGGADAIKPKGQRGAMATSKASRGSTKRQEDEDNERANEEITQNLLELTNNIRENMRAARDIIQRDNETLAMVATSADGVGLKMQKNTDKLGEFVRKGCQCGIWVALVLVTLSFLMMVIFIRLFPKPA